MTKTVILLSVPALRPADVSDMPNLSRLMSGGETAVLRASFPCVTWPVQSNMLTGRLPAEHGVVSNGFYWRDQQRVEMWTAWNDKILASQIWDRLHQRDPQLKSAAWFPMLSKGCGADFVCMPAPIHNPDGSEDLWCYTQPAELYGTLRDRLGHFPLQHFWGPLAGIPSTRWIADSAAVVAAQFRPDFWYVYLPHLDYAAQKSGPDSSQARKAVSELDTVIGSLAEQFAATYGGDDPLWLAASEYVITPVDHVTYPNRVLRRAGLLAVREEDDGEHLDWENSRAWALVDHQLAHVYVKDRDPQLTARVSQLFRDQQGVAQVLSGDGPARYHLNHERSGDVILISAANSWQAYYWWLEDARAPGFARTVDIHRKPGYDPVELHFDTATRSIPLDATLVKGSHGAPVESEQQQGVILASQPGVLGRPALADTDVAERVLSQYR